MLVNTGYVGSTALMKDECFLPRNIIYDMMGSGEQEPLSGDVSYRP